MTWIEYLLIGASAFAGTYLATFTFSVISFLRKRAAFINLLQDMKDQMDTEVSFRKIVETNFNPREDNQ
jgi:hypothetical protein